MLLFIQTSVVTWTKLSLITVLFDLVAGHSAALPQWFEPFLHHRRQRVMGWSKNMHIKELFLHNPNCVTCLPTYMSAKFQPNWWTFRDAEALATFPIWTMAKVWVLTSLLILCAVNSQIMWNKALKFRISLSFCLSRYICVNTTLDD